MMHTETAQIVYLTVKQAADVLQVSKGHIYNLIRAGLPVIHVGERRVRINPLEMHNWLKAQTEAMK